jgi:DNA gyrase/topoisomerase IV subunit A
MEKPDLTGVAPDVAAYIEYLEKELGHSRTRSGAAARSERGAEDEDLSLPPLEATEPATTFQIVTLSRGGLIKRSARHLYERQRRGGMGIFDIDLPDHDAPFALCHADESDTLVLITNKARAFRLRMNEITPVPVRSKGQSIQSLVRLQDGEYPAALLPTSHGVTLVLVSEKGYARALPAHMVGMGMTPGVSLYRYAEFGPVAGACWSGGKGDLLLATRNGLGIRFPEKALALPGGLGIRLENGDAAVGVAAVQPPDGERILLVGSDGRGTLRLMEGFGANKSPGGGGKIAFKSDKVIGALAVTPESDVFIISRLGKMIRFKASEIPPKEGVVQGVNCMSLRGDECVTMVVT